MDERKDRATQREGKQRVLELLNRRLKTKRWGGGGRSDAAVTRELE